MSDIVLPTGRCGHVLGAPLNMPLF